MTRWEYHSEGIRFDRSHQNVLARLNELGDEGWEAIDIEWMNGHEHVLVFLKREKRDEAEKPAPDHQA